MKFSCDDCGAQYMIADEKIGPRGVKVRCKKCANVIILRPQKADQNGRPSMPANGLPSIPASAVASRRSGAPPPPPSEGSDDDEATVAFEARGTHSAPPPPPELDLGHNEALGVSSDLGLSQEFAAHGFDQPSRAEPRPGTLSLGLDMSKIAREEPSGSPFGGSSIGGSLRDLHSKNGPSLLDAPVGIGETVPDADDPAAEPKTSVDTVNAPPSKFDADEATSNDLGAGAAAVAREFGEVATRVGKVDIPPEARRPADEDEEPSLTKQDSGAVAEALAKEADLAAKEKPTEQHRTGGLGDFRGVVRMGAASREEETDDAERAISDRLDKLELGGLAAEESTIDRSDSDVAPSPPPAPEPSFGDLRRDLESDFDAPFEDRRTGDLGVPMTRHDRPHASGHAGVNGSRDNAPSPLAARGQSEPATTGGAPLSSARRPAASAVSASSALVGGASEGLDEEIGSAFEAVFGSGAGLSGETDPFDALLGDGRGTKPAEGNDDKKATKVFDVDAMRRLQDEQELAAVREDEPGEDAKEWYVAVNDEQVGPLNFEEVKQRWQANEVDLNTLCWKQGMADWIAIRFVRELEVLGSDVHPSTLVGRPPLAPAADEERAPSGVARPRDRSVTAVGARERAPTAADLKPPVAPASEPVPSPAFTEEPESSWRPSAASALASLAQAELDTSDQTASKPLHAAATEKHAGPSLNAAMFGAGEHTQTRTGMPLPKASELASSVPLRDPVAGRSTPPWLWGVIGGLAALLLAVVAGAVLLWPKSAPPPPPPAQEVARAPEVPPPPAPPPAAPTAGEAPSAAPAEAPAAAPAEAPAAAELAAAAPAAKEPAEAAPERREPPRERARKRPTRETRTARREEPPPPPPPAPEPPQKRELAAEDLLNEAGRGSRPAARAADPADDLPEKLDDADILRVLRKYKGAINNCREKQAKEDPNLEGVMTVKFVILKTGKTSQHAVSPDKFKTSSVGRCVLGSVKGWSFPRFTGGPMPLDFPVMVRGRG